MKTVSPEMRSLLVKFQPIFTNNFSCVSVLHIGSQPWIPFKNLNWLLYSGGYQSAQCFAPMQSLPLSFRPLLASHVCPHSNPLRIFVQRSLPLQSNKWRAGKDVEWTASPSRDFRNKVVLIATIYSGLPWNFIVFELPDFPFFLFWDHQGLLRLALWNHCTTLTFSLPSPLVSPSLWKHPEMISSDE